MRRARLATFAFALLLALGTSRVASAKARPLIAVVPFTGPQAKAAEAEVVRSLRTRAQLVPASRWRASARKLFAPSHSPEDISAVAEDVGAVLVITGVVKRDGRHWQLRVSVRDGKSGRSRDKLRYPLKGPHLDRQVLSLLGVEVQAAFVHALDTASGEAPPPAANANAGGQPKVAPLDDDDDNPKGGTNGNGNLQGNAGEQAAPSGSSANETERPEQPPLGATPPERAKAPKAAAAESGERPRWAPYFDISAGAELSARSWDFSPSTLPRFATPSVVPGLRVDLTLYPLAFLWDHAHGVFSTLGVGATLDKPFWGPASANDGNKYATSELRVEGGLRWRFVLYKPVPRPELILEAGGGLHQFAIVKKIDPVTMNPVDVGPPDVGYAYVTLGAKVRLHFAEWALIWLGFHYHVVTTAGPATTSDEYGPAKLYGLRVAGGFDFKVWRGLTLGVSAYYERFQLRFLGSDPAPALPGMGELANTATDQYYGGALSVGYEY